MKMSLGEHDTYVPTYTCVYIRMCMCVELASFMSVVSIRRCTIDRENAASNG